MVGNDDGDDGDDDDGGNDDVDDDGSNDDPDGGDGNDDGDKSDDEMCSGDHFIPCLDSEILFPAASLRENLTTTQTF